MSKRVVDHLKKRHSRRGDSGLKNVNTFIGRDWTRTVDENWPRFLKTWRPLIAFAEDHGIKIGIENCPMLFTKDEWPGGKNLATSPVIWRRMFGEIPSKNFGLNYDPSHFVLQQMDPLSPLLEFKGKLFHIHAKDMTVPRRQAERRGHFRGAQGMGTRPAFPATAPSIGPSSWLRSGRLAITGRSASRWRTTPSVRPWMRGKPR